MTDTPEAPRWPRSYEAALLLGVTPGRVAQLVGDGALTVRREGTAVFVDPASLAVYETRRRAWKARLANFPRDDRGRYAGVA